MCSIQKKEMVWQWNIFLDFFVLIQEVLWAPTFEINRELKRDYDSE